MCVQGCMCMGFFDIDVSCDVNDTNLNNVNKNEKIEYIDKKRDKYKKMILI